MNPFDQTEEMPAGARAERPTAEARTRHIRSHTKQAATRVNVVRAVQLPQPVPSEAAMTVSPSAARFAPIAKARGPLIVPQDTVAQFVRVDERDYYFRSGGHAFRHHNDRFTTRSENAQLVATLVSIMETNGARAIAVSGTQKFRQRAWRAAVSSGLSVEGYTPSAFEKAKYLASAPAAQTSIQPTPDSPASSPPPPVKPSALSSELVVGELLDHGRARASADPQAPMSYYVRLNTNAGERTVWGRDLERAFEASRTKPQIGNTIGVRALAPDQLRFGREEVPSHHPARSAAQDPFFIVEKSQYFAMRAAAATVFRDHDTPSYKGVARYPELEGAYWLLKVAASALERDVPVRADRFMFLLSMRYEMATHIERGEPIPTIKELGRMLPTSSAAATAPKTKEPMVRQ